MCLGEGVLISGVCEKQEEVEEAKEKNLATSVF
jgi:hypothetical protein